MQISTTSSKNVPPERIIRDIPIHPTLERLGFLDFVQERSQTHPNERLFSEYKAIQEHAGMLFSRSFAHWIKTTVQQLPDEKKKLLSDDFHFPSLRALFAVEAIRCGKSEETLRQVRNEAQEQCDLEKAAAEMRMLDIESYFPTLYRYEELIA